MSTNEEISTARSEAERRVITAKNKAGHLVKYSGNPAELSGARYEIGMAMRRAGAFQLLIRHGAYRLKSGLICVEDIDSIPFSSPTSSTIRKSTPTFFRIPVRTQLFGSPALMQTVLCAVKRLIPAFSI